MNEKLYKPFNANLDFSGIDHIVIGSGMGGLTAATWLAKAGKKVVVFERHNVPGGFTHSFKRANAFQWDVGVHYVGNMHKESPLRGLFDFLTDYKLDWEPMGEVYDVAQIAGDSYEFKAGKENLRKQLFEYFSNDTQAIDKYFKLIAKANKSGSAFFLEKTFRPILSKSLGWIFRKMYRRYSRKTTLEVLCELTINKRLIAVLCTQCGNYGLSPKYSSFAAHAMVVGHFMEGGYFPKGGPEQIWKKTLEKLCAQGGKVYTNSDVKEIVTENKRVKGIKIGDRFIACKSVISNAGIHNTFNQLLSDKAKQKNNFDFQNLKPSVGHMCLYVGLDRSDEELKLPRYNVWCYDNDNFDDVFENITLQDAPKKFAYISFPSAKDPEWQEKHPGTATIQALSIGRYEWFLKYEAQPWNKRGEEYISLKKEFEETMIKRLYKLFPQIKGHVVAIEVSTPLSTRHFSNYQHGEIYGLEHSPDRFELPFLRSETKIKGLRLVGQDIMIVGLAGAMLSGILCAATILKFKTWSIFRGIAKAKKINRENRKEIRPLS